MNIAIAIIVVAITVYLLLRNYDFRVVLIASGLLLGGIALDPLTVLDEFAFKMVTDSLIQAACATVGFGFVMRVTGCEQQLVTMTAKRLRGFGLVIIPLVTTLTFLFNSVLLSAANTAATVGIVLIPIMIGAGIHPVVAASAILAGTFGSMLNPVLPTNAFVARVAGVDAQAVAGIQQLPVLLALVVVILCLTALAVRAKEHKGYETDCDEGKTEIEKVNLLYAFVPLTPLLLLVLGSSGLVPSLRMGIAQTMLIGALLGLLITRNSATLIADNFFNGMGSAYANIMSMIIAVAVFVRGLKSIGLVSFFITWLTTSPETARAGGVLGPFLMGVITGSGDAAAFAFSEAVAPHAFLYGMETVDMGCLAALSGALGRTMSPLAAAVIVCAAIARVSPIELTKRNCLGMSVALVVVSFII